MDVNTKLELVSSGVSAKLLGRVRPLIVSFIVTEKCNLFCSYCQIREEYELSTKEVLTVVDRLHEVGTKVLILTGGEPFMRKDLDVIVRHAKDKGLVVKINTNGTFLRKRADILKNVNGITISLDGPEQIHDKPRGSGAHKLALDGIRFAREGKVKLNLTAVLSKFNTTKESVDYLLDTAKSFDTYVSFQPASEDLLRGHGPNPVTPDIAAYRDVIDYLIERKKGKNNIANSMTGLRYLRSWPNLLPLTCAGHSLYRRIDHKGNIQICGIVKESFGNIFDENYKQSFQNSHQRLCDQCWCSSRVELNLLASGSLDATLNMFSHSLPLVK